MQFWEKQKTPEAKAYTASHPPSVFLVKVKLGPSTLLVYAIICDISINV